MRPGQDAASSPYQIFPDSQTQSYRPSPVQNAAYPESPNAIGLRLGMEARLKGQEEKLGAERAAECLQTQYESRGLSGPPSEENQRMIVLSIVCHDKAHD